MLNENMEIKTALIIHDKKIISFHEIEDATLYVRKMHQSLEDML